LPKEIFMRRMLAISLVVAVAAVAVFALSFVGVGVAEARGGAAVFAGGTLAMAALPNAGISAEAQHLLNSLEAHFAAVKAAVANGSDKLLAHVEDAWDDVLAAIKGVEFSDGTKATAAGSAAGELTSGAASSAVAAAVGKSAAAAAA
jgi:hypothetical protein